MRGKTSIVQNRNIEKELKTGMTVALSSRRSCTTGPPFIAVLMNLPPNIKDDTELVIQWMNQERAPHKSRWLRYFKSSVHTGSVFLDDIILYDFELTKKGALKKSTRDF